MTRAAPIPMSATLGAERALDRRRQAGQSVLSMASGEIGLPIHPLLRAQLADAAGINAYGSVAGSSALRHAAAGYWHRRGLPTDPELVVAGPGSKALLFALLLAVGGDAVLPLPSWVSYPAQAALVGGSPIPVPTRAGEGGVPDPARLPAVLAATRAAGQDPRCVVVTIPDNPTGTVAAPDTIWRLAQTARAHDLIVISDEIYSDLDYRCEHQAIGPVVHAPERTVITTGLAKNLAAGGWRIGVVRLPHSAAGRTLHDRLTRIASQIWSSPTAPIQVAAAYAFGEPVPILERLAVSRRLHEQVARAVGAAFTEVGALLAPIRATCYLYPDFAPHRGRLARAHDIHGSDGLVRFLAERHGIGVLAGTAFAESGTSLRIRAATGRLYGDTDEQREAALVAVDPVRLPWIAGNIARVRAALADLIGAPTPGRSRARSRPSGLGSSGLGGLS